MNTLDTVEKASKPRGRPSEFNHEHALNAALNVFWTHGFEGTSMAQLTTALGMNKPSIYATFGNKEALFRKVLDQYTAGPAAFVSASLNEPTSLKVAKRFLVGAVNFFANPQTPNGCMIVQGALTCGPDASAIQQLLISYRKNLESSLISRFERSKAEADLPAEVNAKDLALYLTTIHQGLSVQASSGSSKTELLGVVKMALANWPVSAMREPSVRQ